MKDAEGAEVTQRLVDGMERELTHRIIECGMSVHSELGPGLLESVYEESLCHEFHLHDLAFRRQVEAPISYRGRTLSTGIRLDLLVEDRVIVEVKSVEALTRTHDCQLLTYMRLTRKHVGLLMNFNEAHFRDGVRRKVFSILPLRTSA